VKVDVDVVVVLVDIVAVDVLLSVLTRANYQHGIFWIPLLKHKNIRQVYHAYIEVK